MDISSVSTTLTERDTNVYVSAQPNMLAASDQAVATDQRANEVFGSRPSRNEDQGIKDPRAEEAKETAKVEDEDALKESKKEQAAKAEEMRENQQALIDELNLKKLGLQFSVDKESDTSLINVTDVETKDLIRQIPSEDFMKLKESLGSLEPQIKGDEEDPAKKGQLLNATA